MELKLKRIISSEDQQIPSLLELYRESFPPEERRNENQLLKLIGTEEMWWMAVLQSGELAGFILFWDFDTFGFIEHFAIFPRLRGNSLGSSVLKQLNLRFPRLLLEAELPYDQLSTRRLEFYRRNGFQTLNLDYAQPPYRKGEQLLPMHLLSNFSDWEDHELEQAIVTFHNRVYFSHY